MYIAYCPEMYTEEYRFVHNESLTDVLKRLESAKISDSKIVKIIHIGTYDHRETYDTAKDNERYEKMRVYLEPTENGCRADLA